MQFTMAGRRMLTAIAVAAACAAGTASIGIGQAAAHAPVNAGESATVVHPEWQFEFAATHYVTLSCYFTDLDGTNATGPKKFTGKGKNEAAAEKDAWNQAQADAPQGRKVKHCRKEKAWKR
jgi:hypothetical protein